MFSTAIFFRNKDSNHDLCSEGCWFDPRLSQYSDDSHCNRIHPSLAAVHCFDSGYAASSLGRILCGVLVKGNPGNHGALALSKMVFNTYNQSKKIQTCDCMVKS